MFIISRKGNRGAILHDYEFIDGYSGKLGIVPDRIKINGIVFGEYVCIEDYNDARQGLILAIQDKKVERYQLQ